MFEKLNTFEGRFLSHPCDEFISIVKELKRKFKTICIAEIGIGLGATSLPTLELLDSGDTFFLFDFHHVVSEFEEDIRQHPLGMKGVNIILLGNSTKKFDSFNWNFARIILDRKSQGESPYLFDAVYLDGAHTFMHTVAACCLLEKMLKPGGYLVFDDLLWSPAIHVRNNPENFKHMESLFTEEQMKIQHVGLVVDIFMEGNSNYNKVKSGGKENLNRAVYQKNI